MSRHVFREILTTRPDGTPYRVSDYFSSLRVFSPLPLDTTVMTSVSAHVFRDLKLLDDAPEWIHPRGEGNIDIRNVDVRLYRIYIVLDYIILI